MTRAQISNAATETLEQWLNDFMEGRLHFGELPLCVEAFIHYGYSLGRASLKPEIVRLERETNYLYYMLTPERDRRADLEQRLLRRLETASEDDLNALDTFLRTIASNNSDEAPAGADVEHHDRLGKAA